MTLTQLPLSETQTLQIQTARTLEELRLHADRWNRLALESPQQLPMSSHAWVLSYFEECLEVGESWFCLFAYEGAELVGVLPLVVTPRVVLAFKLPLLRTPWGLQTFSVDVLAAKGKENEIILALVKAARQLYPHHLGMEFRRLPEDSPTIAALKADRRGAVLISELDGGGHYLKLKGNFEEYRKRLSSKFRSNLNQRSRKLQQLKDVKITFLKGTDATEKDLSRFMEVEASSWKGSNGTAILNSPDNISFYTALTRHLSEAGWLEWQFIDVEGKTIAGHLTFRFNHSIIFWRNGYDPSYSKYSPGSLLFEQLVKSAYESGEIDEINMMTDQHWHEEWEMVKREYYNLRLYPLNPLSFLYEFLSIYLRRKIRLYATQEFRSSLRKIISLIPIVDFKEK